MNTKKSETEPQYSNPTMKMGIRDPHKKAFLKFKIPYITVNSTFN